MYHFANSCVYIARKRTPVIVNPTEVSTAVFTDITARCTAGLRAR